MISGYNLKKRKLNNKYIRDKFERLMFPYFMTCFGIMVMDCINSVVISHDASIKTITYVIYRDFVRSFWASGSIKSFVGIELGTRIGAIWFLSEHNGSTAACKSYVYCAYAGETP